MGWDFRARHKLCSGASSQAEKKILELVEHTVLNGKESTQQVDYICCGREERKKPAYAVQWGILLPAYAGEEILVPMMIVQEVLGWVYTPDSPEPDSTHASFQIYFRRITTPPTTFLANI